MTGGIETIASHRLAARGYDVTGVMKRTLLVEADDAIVDQPPRTVDDLSILVQAAADTGPGSPTSRR